MNTGWIKLHRSLLDWEWYDDVHVRLLFIHCILKANCRDKRYKGKLINRGAFVTSLETLSNEVGLSISQIRSTIKKLIMTHELTSLTSKEGSIISVTNYDAFQSSDMPVDRISTSQPTGYQQDSDKIVTTNKKIRSKEEEEDKKEKSIKKESFGISGKVKMEQKNYDTLLLKYGLKLVTDKIEAFEASEHIAKKKDHYLTINNWCKRDFKDSGDKQADVSKLWEDE